jgi:two-component system, chemotaxis family, protein-glutamate methylesterase/glutaminase
MGGALSEADAYLRAKTVILDPVFGRIGETGLKRLLQFEADFVVAGEASNGLQAVELSRTLSPDLVIMDIDMPLMNGLEATRRIMADHPLPILIFSNDAGPDTAYEAMASGAIEAMQKPDMDRFNEPVFYAHFLKKLRSLAEARPHPRRSAASDRSAGGGRDRFRLLVMGASTGGPAAVREILSKLPAGFPLPIAQVQHMETGFDAGYVRWLGDGSALPVRLAEREVAMEPGVVWAAPVDRHIRIDRSAARPTLVLDDGAKVLNQRPSVDVLFTSAAEAFGDRLAGILLTGMGRDGARGCLSIVEKRGITLVQDEATSAIFGMPKSAIELGGASRVLPLPEIPGAVQSLLIPAARKEGDR